MTQHAASKLRVYLIAILGIVIWGGSPAATKLAVQSFDGFSVAILRTVFAAALVLPFALVKRLPLPVTRSGWITLGFASVIGNIAYVILFSMGIERTSTIHAALIIASAPIFTGLIGFSVEKKWPRPLWWVGAAVAFAGETFLVLSQSDPAQHASFEGDVTILLSILCVSVGYVCGGRLSTLIGTWAATSWSLAISGVLLIPLFIYVILNVDLTTITQASWGGVAYLVIFTCILGYACWYWAIGQLGVGAIAPLQFGLPLVSVTLGVIIFNEALTFQIFVAAIAILAGIAITRKA